MRQVNAVLLLVFFLLLMRNASDVDFGQNQTADIASAGADETKNTALRAGVLRQFEERIFCAGVIDSDFHLQAYK